MINKFALTKLVRFFTLTILCLTLFSARSFSQCTIQSSDYTCVDDLIGFQATSPIGVTSVAWKFGEGSTSTTKEPKHRYAASGTFTVTATITQTDGTTCTATKDIEVYNPPVIDFEIHSSSKYCLTENEVCIIDNSTSGNTTTTSTKLVILWGDGGKTEVNNPKKGSKICYNYQQYGTFKISVEHTNDKGCEAIAEQQVTIKKDFFGVFTTGEESRNCDMQKNWFSLDTSWLKYKNEIESAIFDFGDGTQYTLKNINDSAKYHDFTASGNYAVYLILNFKNGCQTRYRRNVGISIDKVEINHKISDTVLCYPSYFEFSHPSLSGVSYLWTALDTGMKIVENFGNIRTAYFSPREPGKYYIEVRLKRGDCISVLIDSIEAVGVKALPLLRNSSQCNPDDTVYFCDNSIKHRAGDLTFLWNFQDMHADPCTTDSEKGLNVDKNCNYSVDQNAKHLYDTTRCGEIWFHIYDNLNGCADSTKDYIVIKKPTADDFTANPRKRCLLSPVSFTAEDCYKAIMINYDSSCGREKFVEFEPGFAYKKVCDPSGWVTWGINAITGEDKIYRSCDENDFYIDSGKVCSDTFWYHREFKLNNPPYPQSSIRFTGCLPTTLNGDFYVKTQPDVTNYIVTWGDGEVDTFYNSRDSAQLSSFSHQYTTSGFYKGDISMVTDSGCEGQVYFERKIGFYNDFDYFKPICPGSTVPFWDSVVYWNDTNQYWRWELPLPVRPEKIYWDFDDGNGFVGHMHEPTHVFEDVGTYTVRMASVDSTGCSDTMTKVIIVEDIHSGIKEFGKKLVCDDIVQFFDSSYVADTINDSVNYYYWDFGDGLAPSYLKNPFHFYSSYGTFTVTHVIGNIVGCRDTSRITITIDGPVPHFDILDDTVACAPHTVQFKNNSIKATDYIWYFGDTSSLNNSLSTKSDTNVTFTYNKPGTYYIYLYAGDSVVNPDNNNNVYYCNSTFPDTNAVRHEVRRVVILPIPKVDFRYDGSLCKGKELNLFDQSDTIYKTYRWYWASDSVITDVPSSTIVMNDTGKVTMVYKPTYEPEGPYQRRCYDSITKEIEIFYNEASFEFSQDSICPTFYFTAESNPGDELMWDFGHPESGDKNSSSAKSLSHEFAPEVGDFEVCLISTSPEGCIDTMCQTVSSNHRFSMIIPNVITPNDDGLNDRFEIDIDGEDYYELTIYNRWGELMFHSTKDAEKYSENNWDGTVQGTDRVCPPGTYFYIFEFREGCIDDAVIEKYNGTITLIRD